MKKVLIIAIGSVQDNGTVDFSLCPELERLLTSKSSEGNSIPCLFYSRDKKETELKTVSERTVLKEVNANFNNGSEVEVLIIKEHQQEEISKLLSKAGPEQKPFQLYCMWNYHKKFLKHLNTSTFVAPQQQVSA